MTSYLLSVEGPKLGWLKTSLSYWKSQNALHVPPVPPTHPPTHPLCSLVHAFLTWATKNNEVCISDYVCYLVFLINQNKKTWHLVTDNEMTRYIYIHYQTFQTSKISPDIHLSNVDWECCSSIKTVKVGPTIVFFIPRKTKLSTTTKRIVDFHITSHCDDRKQQ